MTTRNFRRAGKNYTKVQQSANHVPYYNHETTDAATGQPVRTGISAIHIKVEPLTGEIISVATEFTKLLLSNNGQVVVSEPVTRSLQQNLADQAYFIAGLLPSIAPSIDNGFVRGPEDANCLGCNHQPLNDAQGLEIAETAYNREANPSNNYRKHNADGSPVDPSGSPADTTPYKV